LRLAILCPTGEIFLIDAFKKEKVLFIKKKIKHITRASNLI